MENLFLTIVNMSITATWAVLAFTLLRPLLKKAPKWINCLLWGVVALRLCLPFSFESVFSLIPTTETIPSNITMSKNPQIDTGVGVVNGFVNPVISESFTPDPSYSANPLQVIVGVASYIWLIGLVLMVVYCVVSYVLLKRKVSASVHYNNNIYYCDNIETPFILGVIKPKIYVPSGVNESDLEFILEHEKSHLKRKDYLIKPLSFLLLSVYWFNPAIWLWYILLCRDIESACDEKAIKFYDDEYKKLYSTALLNCSTQKRIIMACPVAFGETGVKQRIKSVLNYKKPAFWVVGIAIVLATFLTIFFVTNPVKDTENKDNENNENKIESQNYTYATENTGDFTHIKDNYYYAVIDNTLEYHGLGLYLCDETEKMRFICDFDTTQLQSATIGNTFYYLGDSDYLYKVELRPDAQAQMFFDALYNGEEYYTIESIESVSGKYIYCKARHWGVRDVYPEYDIVYLKIDTETEKFVETKNFELPKTNINFLSLLSEIENILNAKTENVFVQKMNFNFESNGRFESAFITVQFIDKTDKDLTKTGNLLVAEDLSLYFNETTGLANVLLLNTNKLTSIDKVLEKVNIVDNANFCLENVEKQPDNYQLIYFGKALLENGVEREEPYELYYDSLSYVFSENSKAKYFTLKNNKIQKSSKPTITERNVKYISGKEFFIVTPYYKTEEPAYKAFDSSSSVAGELLFVSFNELFNTNKTVSVTTQQTAKNNKSEKTTTTSNVKLVTSNTPPENTTSPEGYTTSYVDYFTPEGEHVYEYYVYDTSN